MLKELSDLINAVGYVDCGIILFISFLELICNIPYLLVKLICYPLWWIYDNYMDNNFYCINFINIPFINKYVKNIETKIKREKKMCDCTILSKNIKLIENTIFIGDKEITNLPKELENLLRNGKPKITINSVNIIIDEWEYKDGKFRKTLRGYIHKYL